MRTAVRWCVGAAAVLVVGSCGSDADNDRVARGLAVAAATDAVAALGGVLDGEAGSPRTQPCLDGVGNPSDARLANHSIALDAIDGAGLDRLVDGLSDGPLQDSLDAGVRLVVYTERRDGVLVTVRVRRATDGRTDIGVTVDCVG